MAQLNSKIVAFYGFDNSSTPFIDSSFNRLNLVNSASPYDLQYSSTGGKPNGYIFNNAIQQSAKVSLAQSVNFSFGNGTTDVNFGGAAFFMAGNVTSPCPIFAKRGDLQVGSQTNNEWIFDTTGASLRLRIFDNNNGAQNGSTNLITFTASGFFANNSTIYHCAFDYDASTKTCRMWKNGVSQTVTKVVTGTYTAMWATNIQFSVINNIPYTNNCTFLDNTCIIKGKFDQYDIDYLYNSGNGIAWKPSSAILGYGY